MFRPSVAVTGEMYGRAGSLTASTHPAASRGCNRALPASSLAGAVGIPTLAPYAAGKGGINQLVRTLAQGGKRPFAAQERRSDHLRAFHRQSWCEPRGDGGTGPRAAEPPT